MIFAKTRSFDYTMLYASNCNVDHSPDRSSQPPMQYFFYGTLCDPDVRRLILGYRPGPRQIRPARLYGFRRKRAAGRSYPVLIRAPGSILDGLLFRPGRPEDAGRLARYEGPEYCSRALPVQPHGAIDTCRALVFLPAGPALPPAKADWQLMAWQRRDKSTFLHSLHNQGPMPCASR
jgi:hypothetical protein